MVHQVCEDSDSRKLKFDFLWPPSSLDTIAAASSQIAKAARLRAKAGKGPYLLMAEGGGQKATRASRTKILLLDKSLTPEATCLIVVLAAAPGSWWSRYAPAPSKVRLVPVS